MTTTVDSVDEVHWFKDLGEVWSSYVWEWVWTSSVIEEEEEIHTHGVNLDDETEHFREKYEQFQD